MKHDQISAAKEQRSPTEPGFAKINTDASIMEDVGSGFGVIIRDDQGQVIKSSYRFQPHVLDVEVAEAVACRDGIILAKELGLTRVIVEMDNQSLYTKLCRRTEEFSYLGNLLG
ncbi:hypothetical protein DH2020_005557 [Rehmannia glutinosa]|uniref:RNase H type-1 domain-containing protein n=1 Tax=Rehmannia glutinosa TaxID=99300 RepID=A0ABR0XGZ4_REHGL